MRPPMTLLASLLLALGAAPAGAQCVAASAAWKNNALPPQSAPFTARFTAAPSAARIDGVTGLSQGPATGFASLAAAVRFNNAGYIDARNGGAYAAGASIPYTAGAVYGFRVAVDPAARRYSVWVTPPGAPERSLATNFAFRTEQAGAASLANWALIATSGSHQVCAFAVGAPPSSADTVAPSVSLASPLAGAALSGSVAMTANASDNVAVAAVQFQVDGAFVGPELTQAPYTTIWNTASATNASHVLTAVARDAAGNKTVSRAVTVAVDNAAPPPPAACAAVSASWQNAAFAPQSGSFSASFDAVPGALRMDGVTGLSNGVPAGYSKLAAAVRFNNAGYIDARNGGAYAAAAAIPYTAGAKYRFRLVVDASARRYSAYVTPPGAAERLLGGNYAFRSEQAAVSILDHWGSVASSGAQQVCGFALSGAAPPPAADTVPPAAAFTSPAAGATVSGSVALTATASDNVGVAGVQFQLDGADLGAELTKAPYSASWNTSSATNASHTLRAVARDAAGNKGAASVTVTVANAATPPACAAVSSAWQGASFPARSAPFIASFEAIPAAAAIDGVTGLGSGTVSSYSQLAAAVRFNNAGYIDARNGGAYAAAAAIAYTAGARYRFRIVADPAARRYTAYVTPPGAAERLLGSNFAFRTEQASATSLDRWAGVASAGSHQVCGFAVEAAPPPAADTVPPTAVFTSPAAGATVSGTVSLTAAASDNVGVASVQFQLDGADLGAPLTRSPYTLAWNSGAATNASHVLRALVRDAAGNQGAASVTVTVNNAPPPAGGADRFGVKMLYPTMAGGKNWVSTWDNGRARTFTSGQADPFDPWFRGRGNATYSADGKGVFSLSGSVPRMYIHDPALLSDWRNTESTVYAYRVADSGTAYGGIVHVTRTNHSAIGASETINGCDSRGNGARIRYDGHIDFEKETKHPSSSPTRNKALWSTLPYRTWIGYKLVVYDLPNGNVKLEHYMDLTDGANGGTWTKINELEDNGANFGVGGTPCKSGIDPAIRLRTGNVRLGSETGRPNPAVYFRTDNVGTNGLLYKKMSVREISPP